MYAYDNPPGALAAFSSTLSLDRLEWYLGPDAAAGDLEQACRWYTFNTAVSAAFYPSLQALEVTLRNRVAHRLDHWYPTWTSGDAIFREPDCHAVREARQLLENRGKPITRGRIVAELSFGFWTGLFANVYDTDLWRTTLHTVVYPRMQRHELFDQLDRLRTLRNRIAHHEPIIQRRLLEDHDRMMNLLERMCPETWQWVASHDRTLNVLATGHDVLDCF